MNSLKFSNKREKSRGGKTRKGDVKTPQIPLPGENEMYRNHLFDGNQSVPIISSSLWLNTWDFGETIQARVRWGFCV